MDNLSVLIDFSKEISFMLIPLGIVILVMVLLYNMTKYWLDSQMLRSIRSKSVGYYTRRFVDIVKGNYNQIKEKVYRGSTKKDQLPKTSRSFFMKGL